MTITATNIRDWVGLKTADIPSDATITYLLTVCTTIIGQDTSILDTNDMYDILVLFKTSARVLKWLANRTVKDGYKSFSTAAGSVNKSPNELLQLAKDMEDDYDDFVQRTIKDVGSSKFLTGLNNATQQDFKDIFQGVSNAWDFQGKYRPSINSHVDYGRAR